MTEKIQYKLNLPADIDGWLRGEASKACRSRSGQIIYLLREQMAAAGGEFGDQAPAATNHTDALTSA